MELLMNIIVYGIEVLVIFAIIVFFTVQVIVKGMELKHPIIKRIYDIFFGIGNDTFEED